VLAFLYCISINGIGSPGETICRNFLLHDRKPKAAIVEDGTVEMDATISNSSRPVVFASMDAAIIRAQMKKHREKPEVVTSILSLCFTAD
jgi:hypothetical protein